LRHRLRAKDLYQLSQEQRTKNKAKKAAIVAAYLLADL
jgi:hypothetical protein